MARHYEASQTTTCRSGRASTRRCEDTPCWRLEQIAQTVFWASLCSLDILERIHGNYFKNDPLVSSELVKFMAINTGFEGIESLKKTVTDHQDSIDKAVKRSTAAEKAASAAANKADKGKRSLEAAVKHIVKIEATK
jgi:hypothetical protein